MRNTFVYLYLFVDYCVVELLMEHNRQFKVKTFYFDFLFLFFAYLWCFKTLNYYFILIFILSNQDKLA